jgi:hypothetical protein
MDYKNMTAPCGLDCFNCPLNKALTDDALRRKISEGRNVEYEKAVCKGCRNENGTIGFLNMTEPCGVFECITVQGIDFCHQCQDFPCDRLHPYADMAQMVPHNTYFTGKWKL